MKILALTILLTTNIILINTQQTCNLITPNSKDDCLGKSKPDELCCFLTAPNLNTNKSICHSLPISSYSGEPAYTVNGNTYFIDCGVNVNPTPLPVCGPKGPLSVKNCMTGSSYTNSCCYNPNTQTCYWLGTKYTGETVWAGLRLSCNGYYYSVSMILLVAFISMLL
jgi:hypothetical protein